MRASSTELLPADWSPHTTSCGNDKTPLRPHFCTFATTSRTCRCSSDCRFSGSVVDIILVVGTGVNGRDCSGMSIGEDDFEDDMLRGEWCCASCTYSESR